LGLRFFEKSDDSPRIVEPDDTEVRGLFAVDWQGGDRDVRLGIDVCLEHPLKIHAVELIARKDQDVVDPRPLNRSQVLPHGVCRSLVPLLPFERLLGREDFYEAAAEQVELVRLIDVPVKTDRVELREDVDAIEPAVEAVRDRDVDEAVFAGQWHGGLGPQLRERVEPGPFASAEDERDDVAHDVEVNPRGGDTSWNAINNDRRANHVTLF